METQTYFCFFFNTLYTEIQYSDLREDCYGHLQIPLFILLTLFHLTAPVHLLIKWQGLILLFFFSLLYSRHLTILLDNLYI